MDVFVAGERTETRFLRAIQTDTGSKPAWFIKVLRATALLDMSGIDAIALVRYPKISEPVRIPIQIKSSIAGRESYFRHHPDAREARVVVIIIHERMDDDMICRTLYRELGEVWRDRVLYKEFFLKNITRPITPRGTEIMEEIRGRRQGLPAKA